MISKMQLVVDSMNFCFARCWLNLVKNMLVKMDHFPKDRGENGRNIFETHHLEYDPKTFSESQGRSTPYIVDKLILLLIGNPYNEILTIGLMTIAPKFNSEFTPEKWWLPGRRSGFLLGFGNQNFSGANMK